MTVGLWGCADSSRAAFPDVVMFPIMPHSPRHGLYAAPSRTPSSRASSGSNGSNGTSPPSPPVSPLLSDGLLRVAAGTPPLTARATSTPGPVGHNPGLDFAASCPPASPNRPSQRDVCVAEDIPLHAASRTFSPADVVAEDVEKGETAVLDGDDRLELRQFPDGCLDVDGEPVPRWLQRLRLADDCHSANLQLQQLSAPAAPSPAPRGVRGGRGAAVAAGPRCLIRAVRPLSRGQTPQLWFADGLLACLRLPFLAPHNIQGEKRYVCHRCGRSFEFPNPLKLHLSLDCGREGVDELWRRLQRLGDDGAYAEDKAEGRERKDSSAFRPYSNNNSSNTSNDSGVAMLSLSGSSLNGTNGSSDGHNSGPSLFGAFHHWALSSPALRPALPNLPLPLPHHHHHHHQLLPRPLPPPPEPLVLGGHGHGLGATRVRDAPPHAHQASYHQHASDMETLVSNLGRSKQGHLCIYCGKVYSRKYGLKIHIRTHTGFKPLKCKYCLRPFGDPSNLNKHVRLHAEGDTPYKCDLCGKVLVRRRDLERHVKSRHQEGVEGSEWDNDSDNEEVDVDVGEESKSNDEDEDEEHCNGSGSLAGALGEQQRGAERDRARAAGADIAIPTA